MKPTDEQLEALEDVADANYCVNNTQIAEAFWAAIVPIVLDAAAKMVAESEMPADCPETADYDKGFDDAIEAAQAGLRALKGEG